MGEVPDGMVALMIPNAEINEIFETTVISGFRLIASDNGVVIAASYWGKFKTTFQMVSVVLLILDIPALAFVTTICVWIALVLTIVSLVDYIYKNHKILTEGSI